MKLAKGLILLLAVCLFSTSLYAEEADDILGYWYIPEDSDNQVAVAHIFENEDKYYAVGFALKDQRINDTKDVNNINPKLRDRLLIDVLIIKYLVFEEDKWINGEIYNPENGKTYHLLGSLSDDKKEIKLRASLDEFSILGTTLVWGKVDDPSKYKPLELPEHKLNSLVDAIKR